jgi:hypothetical protein
VKFPFSPNAHKGAVFEELFELFWQLFGSGQQNIYV